MCKWKIISHIKRSTITNEGWGKHNLFQFAQPLGPAREPTQNGDAAGPSSAANPLPSGACFGTKVMTEAQKFLTCLLTIEIERGSPEASSQELMGDFKTVIAFNHLFSPRCNLLFRTCARLKTGVQGYGSVLGFQSSFEGPFVSNRNWKHVTACVFFLVYCVTYAAQLTHCDVHNLNPIPFQCVQVQGSNNSTQFVLLPAPVAECFL